MVIISASTQYRDLVDGKTVGSHSCFMKLKSDTDQCLLPWAIPQGSKQGRSIKLNLIFLLPFKEILFELNRISSSYLFCNRFNTIFYAENISALSLWYVTHHSFIVRHLIPLWHDQFYILYITAHHALRNFMYQLISQ